MKHEKTSTRLQQIMKKRNLRQVDILDLARPFCTEYGVKLNKSDLSQYVSGKVEPGQDKLFILGRALNVSEAWLMGFDVPMIDTEKLHLNEAKRKLAQLTKTNPDMPSGERVTFLFDELDYDPAIISFNLSLDPAFLNGWLQNNNLPPRPVAEKIFSLLRVKSDEMLNQEELAAFNDEADEWDTSDHQKLPPEIEPMPELIKVPRLGNIACGVPIMAEENFDGYDDVPKYVHADFTLVCKGDSMINARIYDGDVVCIHLQETVENGEIAAVLVDGDSATLKRVRLYPDHLILEPENPQFRPLSFWEEEMNRVRILGKATHFISSVR